MWLYFIFAICQWLPTNHRLFYEDKSPFQRDKCHLCLSRSKEDIHHTLFLCPALDAPRQSCKLSYMMLFRNGSFPTSICKDLRGKMERYWQKLFPKGVSAERLCALSKDYWESNCHKPNIPRAAFGTHLSEVLTVHQQKGTQCLSEIS